MVTKYLNALKNNGNFTVKEIAKLSGIPEATIHKVLSGETADPRFDTVVKLVSAMGGSLEELADKKGAKQIESNSVVTIKEMYDDRIKDLKEHNASLVKDKRTLTVATVILVAVLVLLLVLDVSIGTHGWVRY